MKRGIPKHFLFIGRSLVWSLLLYVVMMLVFNWDEVSNTIKGKNSVTVMTSVQVPAAQVTNEPAVFPANITEHASAMKNILTVLKQISGITDKVARVVNAY